MPVPLPPQPTGPTPLPAAPQDPPTLVDISNSIIYNKHILVSYEAGIATQNDVGEGAIYQTALVAHNAGGAVAPMWFGPALAAGLAAGLAPLNRTTSMTFNLLAGDGHSRPFKVVPFVNGSLPTAAPYNLPALVNVGVVNALTGQECTAYLNGYNLPVPHATVDRKRAIRHEIGCTAVA